MSAATTEAGSSLSVGEGHNFNDANTLGHIKDYSPRTNVAHNFAVDADTLSNVKASGPSPGGGGHHGCC